MTTKTWMGACLSSNTAAFQAWGSAISTSFTDVGLTKTADTGQIDWSTIVYSAATTLGYEIWRFNDALQATAPIFFKITYGVTGSLPYVTVSVGQGSNGAGVLTGLVAPVNTVHTANTDSGNAYPSYVCYNPAMGFLGVSAYMYNIYSGIVFMIARSCDDDGVPNADGYTFYYRNQSYMVSYIVNTAMSGGVNYALVPGNISSGAVDGEIQVFKHYTAMPKIRSTPQLLTYLFAEIGALSQFAATPFGVTPHNYLALGKFTDSGWASGSNLNHALAMLWE